MKMFLHCCVLSVVIHSLGINCGDKTNTCPAAVTLEVLLSAYWLLEYPQAARETTIAATSWRSVSRLPSFLTSTLLWFGCAEEVRRGAGGSPDLVHLVDWRHWVYTAQLVMVSASSGEPGWCEIHNLQTEGKKKLLGSNGCCDAQEAEFCRL